MKYKLNNINVEETKQSIQKQIYAIIRIYIYKQYKTAEKAGTNKNKFIWNL